MNPLSSEDKSICRPYQYPLHTIRKETFISLSVEGKRMVLLLPPSLLSLPEEKQSKKCESWVAQFSISADVLSCCNQMCASRFNQAYLIRKVRFITTHVQKKNPFTPRPVTDAAQSLSLPLKYLEPNKYPCSVSHITKSSPTWEPPDTSHTL